jgi:hypothetical protein
VILFIIYRSCNNIFFILLLCEGRRASEIVKHAVNIDLDCVIATCQNSGTMQPHQHGCVMHDMRNIVDPTKRCLRPFVGITPPTSIVVDGVYLFKVGSDNGVSYL